MKAVALCSLTSEHFGGVVKGPQWASSWKKNDEVGEKHPRWSGMMPKSNFHM